MVTLKEKYEAPERGICDYPLDIPSIMDVREEFNKNRYGNLCMLINEALAVKADGRARIVLAVQLSKDLERQLIADYAKHNIHVERYISGDYQCLNVKFMEGENESTSK